MITTRLPVLLAILGLLGFARTGFIATELVRGPADYRAFFSPTAAGWRMTILVAGD